MGSDTNDRGAIAAVIHRYLKAFNDRDFDGLISLYEPSDDTVLYDIGEPREQRGGDGWRIVHEHLSMPLDMATRVADTECRV
jgi:ketosteroid isomerase-like protein